MKKEQILTHSDVSVLPIVFICHNPPPLDIPGVRACVRSACITADDGAEVPVFIPDSTVLPHQMTPLEFKDYTRILKEVADYEQQPWFREKLTTLDIPRPPIFTTVERALRYIELSDYFLALGELRDSMPPEEYAARLRQADYSMSVLLMTAV